MNNTMSETPATTLEGLRGWLILVGIGFCLAPLRILKQLADNANALSTDTWRVLTTPGTEAYHPLWAPVIIGESVLNLVLLAFSLGAVHLFFKRHRAFPRVAIAFLAAGLVGGILDVLVVQMIPIAATQIDASDIKSITQAGISAAIWIPYFLRSRRVRATFVR